jgi:hypothetical protein
LKRLAATLDLADDEVQAAVPSIQFLSASDDAFGLAVVGQPDS